MTLLTPDFSVNKDKRNLGSGEVKEFDLPGPKFSYDVAEMSKTTKNPFFNNDTGVWAGMPLEHIVDVLQNSNIKLVDIVGSVSEVEVVSFKPGFNGDAKVLGQRLFVFNEYLK